MVLYSGVEPDRQLYKNQQLYRSIIEDIQLTLYRLVLKPDSESLKSVYPVLRCIQVVWHGKQFLFCLMDPTWHRRRDSNSPKLA